MLDLLRLLQAAPTATRLVTQISRAQQGDQEALEYLKSAGWSEALDLVKPGAGEIGRQVLQQAQDALHNIQGTIQGGIIDGEAHEVYPWDGFLRRLLRQPNSSHIILGPTGSGKTTLAMRLAQALSEEQNYKVEFCNVYGDDLPDFGVTISMETLTARMRKLSKYLKNQTTEDEDADYENAEPTEQEEETKGVGMPPMNRVIVLDEAILAMTSNPNDPGRKAALQALAQCRHLRWHCIWIGQWAGQIPLPLLGQAILWVKRPNGRESLTDRDHPIVRDLWERAGSGFNRLSSMPYYVNPYRDKRSWAFVDCESLNGGAGFSGMVPFNPIDVDNFIEAEYREVMD